MYAFTALGNNFVAFCIPLLNRVFPKDELVVKIIKSIGLFSCQLLLKKSFLIPLVQLKINTV